MLASLGLRRSIKVRRIRDHPRLSPSMPIPWSHCSKIVRVQGGESEIQKRESDPRMWIGSSLTTRDLLFLQKIRVYSNKRTICFSTKDLLHEKSWGSFRVMERAERHMISQSGSLPFPNTQTNQLAKSRSPGERDGWVFHHAVVTKPRWCMTDEITYRLPDHTEENPQLETETFQAAISQAYHRNWERHSRMVNKNQKDKDAGKQLPRCWI